MRLIDADYFVAEMEKLYRDAGWEDEEVHFSLNDLRENINVEKTYKQKLPRWIIYHVDPIHPKNISDLMSPGDFYICPICGGHSNVDANYCPYCGEKLGKAEKAEEKQVQPEIIRCKDCIHRPIIDDSDATDGLGLRFPDFRCPCRCDDGYYSWMPNDNWFCGNGEKEERCRMNETDTDALVHKFSPEEWRDKIREGMNRLGLYFEGDETKDERKSRKASSGEAE